MILICPSCQEAFLMIHICSNASSRIISAKVYPDWTCGAPTSNHRGTVRHLRGLNTPDLGFYEQPSNQLYPLAPKTEVSCACLRAQTYLYSWVCPMTAQDICWGAAAKRVDMLLPIWSQTLFRNGDCPYGIFFVPRPVPARGLPVWLWGLVFSPSPESRVCRRAT
jgi:hypothetical protein